MGDSNPGYFYRQIFSTSHSNEIIPTPSQHCVYAFSKETSKHENLTIPVNWQKEILFMLAAMILTTYL